MKRLRTKKKALSLKWAIPGIGLLLAASLSPDAPAADNPRIAMLWSPAQGSESRAQKMARYDIVLTSPDGIGLEWRDEKYADLAQEFVPDSIAPARKRLARMQEAHPGVAVVLELYFYEADEENYPPESPWWYRDKKGKKVQFWKGCYNMDVSNAEYREHILKRVAAIHAATEGKAGLFFDNLRFEKEDKAAWVALLGTIRERFGEIPILVNSGWESEDLDWVTPLVNGIMFEDSIEHTSDKNTEAYYARVQDLNQKCRQPHLSVNEIFGNRDDAQEMKRELARTLVYTDAHFLYADSTYGHRHNWWPEWDAPLGAPSEPARKPAPGKLAKREFEGGVVTWLPADAAKAVELELAEPLTPFGTIEPVSRLSLEPGSGLILLKKPGVAGR